VVAKVRRPKKNSLAGGGRKATAATAQRVAAKKNDACLSKKGNSMKRGKFRNSPTQRKRKQHLKEITLLQRGSQEEAQAAATDHCRGLAS